MVPNKMSTCSIAPLCLPALGVSSRERERDKERERQTDRQTETERERQTDRQRQRDRETEREIERENSKTLLCKDCSLGLVKSLTTSPC